MIQCSNQVCESVQIKPNPYTYPISLSRMHTFHFEAQERACSNSCPPPRDRRMQGWVPGHCARIIRHGRTASRADNITTASSETTTARITTSCTGCCQRWRRWASHTATASNAVLVIAQTAKNFRVRIIRQLRCSGTCHPFGSLPRCPRTTCCKRRSYSRSGHASSTRQRYQNNEYAIWKKASK